MRQKRRGIRTIIGILLAAVLLHTGPGFMGLAADEVQPEENVIHYIALGDSIPNGYSADEETEIVNYPTLLAEDIEEVSGTETELDHPTKNGLTTTKLNNVILQQPEVQEELAEADVITLTIGSNDLMNEFKKVSREILNNETKFRTADEALKALQDGISENPLLLVKVAGAIAGWDYDSFEEQWKLALETICSYRQEDSQMVVTTIYNPVEKMELPGTLNAVVNNLISTMNDIIWDYAEEYDYEVVDLFDSEIGEYTQSDGLHPNQRGQELICSLIEEQLDMQRFEDIRMEKEKEEAEIAEARAEEERRAAEEEKKEAEERERQVRLERREKTVKRVLLGGGVILAAAAGYFVYRKKR